MGVVTDSISSLMLLYSALLISAKLIILLEHEPKSHNL